LSREATREIVCCFFVLNIGKFGHSDLFRVSARPGATDT
jgi:hypothetical protein